MSVRLPLALVALVLLAAVGTLWYVLSGPPTASGEAALPAPSSEGREARDAGPAELPPPASPRPETGRADPSPGREAIALADTEVGTFAIPGDAWWIDGRVVIPADTPLDERLEVEASGRRFTDDRQSPRQHTVAVERNGRFRVALGAKTRKGFLSLSGRYLFLDEKVHVDPNEQEGEVVLEPSLGGVIAGELRLPAGEIPSAELFDAVVLTARCWAPGRDLVQRATKPTADGRFELTALPPGGDYALALAASVYIGGRREGILVSPGKVTELTLELERGARIAGRILDGNGEGVAGATLALENELEREFGHSSSSQQKISGEDGSFEFTGLAAGRVSLRVRARDLAEHVEELGKLEVGEVRDGLELRIDEGLALGGRVLWPDGNPAAGATVEVRHTLEGDESYWDARKLRAETDAEGAFRIVGLEPRPLVVTASARRELAVRDEGAGAGDTSKPRRRRNRGPLWRIEEKGVAPGTEGLILILGSGETLRGRVVDDTGAPVNSYRVQATPRIEEGGRSRFEGSQDVSCGARSETGEFELDGLTEGTWRVRISGSGIVDSPSIEVTIPADAPLFVRVERAARLAGVVKDPTGKPVAEAEIEYTVTSGSSTSRGSLPGRTDREGRFEVDDAPVGAVTLHAEAPGWAMSEGLELAVRPAEELDGLVLVLRRGARLTGEVHPSAAPVSHREIDVWVSEASFRDSTHSDEEGRFQLEGLPPGEARVRLFPPPDESGQVDRRLLFGIQDEEKVTLTEGGTTHVVLGEPSATSILLRGRVTVGGQSLAGLVVSCGRDRFRAATACDDLGNYELQVDGPGTYGFSISLRNGDDASFSRELGAESSQREDFDLPVGSIEGVVLGPDAEPVAATTVVLERVDEKGRAQDSSQLETKSDGTFRFGFLEAGSYRLRAGGPSWHVETSRYAATVIDGLALAEGQALGRLVVELSAGGSITGRITGADGESVRAVWMRVTDEAGREVAATGVQCEPDGSYTLSGLPAGTLTLEANGVRGKRGSTTVKVVVGAVSRADLYLSE